MEPEVFNLSIKNLVQHLNLLYQGSKLLPQFARVAKKAYIKESEEFDFILEDANYCVTGRKEEKYPLKVSALNSIFNLLFQNTVHKYDVQPRTDIIPYPVESIKMNLEQQNNLLEQFIDDWNCLPYDDNYLNKMLDVCEDSFAYISDEPNSSENYLSLADKLKFSTALSTCFYQYIPKTQENILGAKLKDKLHHQKSLLLFSCDISGIQKFIYTVSGKKVLKSLRSRSFYIDILLEHVINSVLQKLGLPSSNKIYSGGGRAYLLLANTESTKQIIKSSMQSINNWLLKNFDISLYIAYGYTECSAEELFLNTDRTLYNAIFTRLSAKLSANKASRYHPEQIKWLNDQINYQHGRECRICSRSNSKIGSDDVCNFCSDFIAISPFLLDESLYLVILSERLESDLPCLQLPSISYDTNYLYFLNQKQFSEITKDKVIQIYHHGKYGPGQRLETGTYAYTSQGEMATFEQLAGNAEGIQRIAVLRADVDNLGHAFMNGFAAAESSGHHSLLLTSALSKRLSIFFKQYMKKIVDGTLREELFTLTPTSSEKKKLVIVYSGGDDLFLAGAWNDVMDTAINLKNCFEKYTMGSLSLSAGIGVFETKYPLYAMAEETEKLVDAAKAMDENKNAVAIFGQEIQRDTSGRYHSVAAHCYHWKDFTEKVIGEKLDLLLNYFTSVKELNSENGNSFLYHLQNLIEETQHNLNDRINIARFAYILARMAPAERDSKLQNLYSNFSLKMYSWILKAEDRQQLLTAITLYVYMKRSADNK